MNTDTMNQPSNLPPGLPPLPQCCQWCGGIGEQPAIGGGYRKCINCKGTGYADRPIEAVREEPAKEMRPTPDAINEALSEQLFELLDEPAPATDANGCEGVEARVCADIAARQRLGIAKYGCTVEQSGDDMLHHAYEEVLDLAVYLKAEIERRAK